jgi:hypothetical protein
MNGGTFWIGDDKHAPTMQTRSGGNAVDTSSEARAEILRAFGRDPKSGPGSIPAAVATKRLTQYDFSNETLPAAAELLSLARKSKTTFGAMLRWL